MGHVAPLLKAADSRANEQAWLAFTYVFDPKPRISVSEARERPIPADVARTPPRRSGTLAYMPKEWDGHWWGTQPVKNPAAAEQRGVGRHAQGDRALGSALADREAAVRLAAAQALTRGAGPEALPALRARLAAETEPAVRRQLIETLGVQKDPEALGVFTKIALDEKADADFRDTAIGAVASIGGDEAKKTMRKLASAALSPSATRRVIEAVGEMKVLEAAPGSHPQRTRSPTPACGSPRSKRWPSLGAKATPPRRLIGVLHDKDGKVVTAALEALGRLHDKRALPRCWSLAKKKRGRETDRRAGQHARSAGDPGLPQRAARQQRQHAAQRHRRAEKDARRELAAASSRTSTAANPGRVSCRRSMPPLTAASSRDGKSSGRLKTSGAPCIRRRPMRSRRGQPDS